MRRSSGSTAPESVIARAPGCPPNPSRPTAATRRRSWPWTRSTTLPRRTTSARGGRSSAWTRGAPRLGLPSFPLKARWTALEILNDDPGLQDFGARQAPWAQVEMLQTGTVWQAEEAREGGKWRRYYGFLGRHVRAQVPADEIEFPAPWNTDWHRSQLTSRARLIPPGGFDDGTRIVRREVSLAGPLAVEVWLRNNRGVETLVSTDWSRQEKGVSIREGVSIRVFRLSNPPATKRVAVRVRPLRWKSQPGRLAATAALCHRTHSPRPRPCGYSCSTSAICSPARRRVGTAWR